MRQCAHVRHDSASSRPGTWIRSRAKDDDARRCTEPSRSPSPTNANSTSPRVLATCSKHRINPSMSRGAVSARRPRYKKCRPFGQHARPRRNSNTVRYGYDPLRRYASSQEFFSDGRRRRLPQIHVPSQPRQGHAPPDRLPSEYCEIKPFRNAHGLYNCQKDPFAWPPLRRMATSGWRHCERARCRTFARGFARCA